MLLLFRSDRLCGAEQLVDGNIQIDFFLDLSNDRRFNGFVRVNFAPRDTRCTVQADDSAKPKGLHYVR